MLNSSDPALPAPQIAILLCTYNGEQFLPEQLDSFQAQRFTHWKAWASDDNSQDSTVPILETYQKKWGQDKLSILKGPTAGSTANFLSLLYNPAIQADYYAYSDQDDIWEADKLERAAAWLKTIPADTPAMYCSRTRVVDINNREIGQSPLYRRPPSFANALAQNIASGNTMVFNHAACALLREQHQTEVSIHDWWTYLAISGCGGKVFYDPHPSLRYRQHGKNLIGIDSGPLARLARIRKLFQGYYKDWGDRNVQSLQQLRPRLSAQNQRTFDYFANARQSALPARIVGVVRSGIYRQNLIGNLGLIVGTLFNKL